MKLAGDDDNRETRDRAPPTQGCQLTWTITNKAPTAIHRFLTSTGYNMKRFRICCVEWTGCFFYSDDYSSLLRLSKKSSQ
ncbi:hypothetical protein OUZ56_032226 [Daphnia magna]|uniref:Uncharacterized protein n=1 Tax=Daphnia magna TaxID=35525 RepID=A0ABQ9ZWK8_9CRUS|nr:hypothetical protein OUZ56_032226 [Daphnia magna]